ncbi:MAG TPA: hypothetical protein VKH63_13695 [Candidatus Acidoferrum sp.]|jgi:hypothetical protein|nr:hypothetical protein [Candidatus Acidoferrum sp.]
MAEKCRFTLEEKTALLRELKKILRNDDEREFMKILRKFGIKDEDPRFAEVVKFFRDLRGRKS